MDKYVVQIDDDELVLTNWTSEVIDRVRHFMADSAYICHPAWGQARVNVGWDDRGIWSSPRYFPGSDKHGNGGSIPDDAKFFLEVLQAGD